MNPSAIAARVRGVLVLVLLAASAAGLLAALHDATRERIVANEAEQVLQRLSDLLPAEGFDNAPQLDIAELTAPGALGSRDALPAYRVRRDGQPVAAVLTVVAPDGYVDEIRLLVGIRWDGRLLGVRATEHSETPGLGDGIETGRSDWILNFSGRRLDGATRWALARDGGDFDALTGATITSRAVVDAVARALEYFGANRDLIFSQSPPDEAGTAVDRAAAAVEDPA